MPESTSSIERLMHSLSFRLQFITVFLSLVGVFFGVRSYMHIQEHFGAENSAESFSDLIWQIGIASLFNILSAVIIYNIVTKPVRNLGEVMRAVTTGQLDLEVPYTDQVTEIGGMARKVAIFRQNAIDKKNLERQQDELAVKAEEEKKQIMKKLAEDFEATILSVVGIVADAANDMEENAKNLFVMADKTSEQSAAVASATEQTSVSVQTVAAAVEELSASIGEINYQVIQSRNISNEAVIEVHRADKTISSLSQAAEQIGDVVKLIKQIAGQTNLLALNAAIEAARAGDAGKGFAVVASEVKALASQTAQATEEIAKKITTVQNVSLESVAAIRGIGKTIEETNTITTSISVSIQQQTEAAHEISRNVQQASIGTGKISASIIDVSKDATESHRAADEVLKDSGKLLQQAGRLQSEIKTFIEKIRKD
jgi:methyl-accepting chemotaxis protein